MAPLRKLEASETGIVMDLSMVLPRVVLESNKSSPNHTQVVWHHSLFSQRAAAAPSIYTCSVLAVLRLKVVYCQPCALSSHGFL